MFARVASLLPILLATSFLAGCLEEESKSDEKAERADDDDDQEQEHEPPPSASVTAASAEPEGATGPMVTIPAGQFRAGSRCFDVPRIRPHELEHEPISMGEFQMDLHPYPNEPSEPAKVGVTWHEAKKLCEERGKRLCSELEWEYACKGPESTTYMWGDGFKTGHCKGDVERITDRRPECITKHGVKDMMGLALEWTGSDWERGTPTGDKVARGSRAQMVSWLSARCTHSRKRDPNASYDNVGFRCCSGPENSAKVVTRPKKEATVELNTGIDAPYEMLLMKSMPRDHRGIAGVELSFDEVYYWHPVADEEMVIGRWKGEPESGGAFYELAVFKVCGSRAWLAGRMRGPVESIGAPKVGTNPRRLRFDVTSGDRSGAVELKFWHGAVKIDEPPWVKKGNQLKVSAREVRKKLPAMRLKKK